MRDVVSDQEKNDSFREQGFICDQLLNEAEVAHLRSVIEMLFPQCRQSSNEDAPKSQYLVSSYGSNDIELRAHLDSEVRAIMSRRLGALLKDYKIHTCGVFIKDPGGIVFGLHHHWTALDDYRKCVVNVWCPLQPTSVESGTLHVLPNTHQIFPEIVSFAYQPYYLDYEAEIRAKYSVPISCQPGEAIVFDQTLLHWSTPNLTSEPRIAIHCSCIPSEEKPVLMYFDAEHPDRFEMYRTDESFYVKDLHIPPDLKLPRPTQLEFLGYVPNQNEALNQNEFEDAINRANEVRSHVMATDLLLDPHL